MKFIYTIITNILMLNSMEINQFKGKLRFLNSILVLKNHNGLILIMKVTKLMTRQIYFNLEELLNKHSIDHFKLKIL